MRCIHCGTSTDLSQARICEKCYIFGLYRFIDSDDSCLPEEYQRLGIKEISSALGAGWPRFVDAYVASVLREAEARRKALLAI